LLAAPIALIVHGSSSTKSLEPVTTQSLGDVTVADSSIPAPAAAAASSDQAPDASTGVGVSTSLDAAQGDQNSGALDAEAASATTAAAAPQLQATAQIESVQTAAPSTNESAIEVTAKKRSCAVTYKPVQGDYWILVAQRANVGLSDLLDANG